MEEEPYPSGKLKLYPCDICGRNFNQESLGKHRNACRKLSKPKRKVFDSGKQRAMGSDVNYVKTKETMKVQVEGVKPKQEVPKTNWRQNHQQFLKSIEQARMVQHAIDTGAPLPKFQPSEVPSNYINCPYCNRNFSPSAAERHIKFCETQHKRQKMSSGNNNMRPAMNQQQKPSAGRMMPPQAPAGNRKQSSEMYNGGGGGGGYANTDYQNRYNSGNYGSAGGGGYNSGYSSGYSSSGRNQGPPPDRKPVRYDSRGVPTSNPSSGYGYSNNNNNNGNALLRTGRNLSNSELNSLARNRSGSNSMKKESPVNSRRPPAQQQQQQNGMRATYVRGPAPSNGGGGGGSGGGGGFCGECGSAFPVEWAKFCSFCGDRRF